MPRVICIIIYLLSYIKLSYIYYDIFNILKINIYDLYLIILEYKLINNNHCGTQLVDNK